MTNTEIDRRVWSVVRAHDQLTVTDVQRALGNHLKGPALQQSISRLQNLGRLRVVTAATAGRPRTVLYPIRDAMPALDAPARSSEIQSIRERHARLRDIGIEAQGDTLVINGGLVAPPAIPSGVADLIASTLNDLGVLLALVDHIRAERDFVVQTISGWDVT